MLKWWKVAFKFLLMLAAATLFLWAVGDLSFRASVAIALVAACTWTLPVAGPKAQFTPYRVHLRPHIGLMLTDIGFIDDTVWKEHFTGLIPTTPWTSKLLCKYGTTAVVLGVTDDGGNLVRWMDFNYYTTALNFNMQLDFFDDPEKKWSVIAPYFFMRAGEGGYHIGVEIPMKWWEENKSRVESLAIIKHMANEHQYGMVRLTFEIFPYEAFRSFNQEYSPTLHSDISRATTAAGWKLQERDWDLPHLALPYQSKYADVTVDSLPDGR